MDLGVERLALGAEARDLQGGQGVAELVRERPQRTLGGQVAVLFGAIEVVGQRQQFPGDGRLGQLPVQLPVAVDAAPVVGVLRGDALQVVGPFVELGLQARGFVVDDAGPVALGDVCAPSASTR